MKPILYNLVLAILFLGCSNEEYTPKQIQITGEVINYNPLSEFDSFKFNIRRPYGMPDVHTVFLNDSGYFLFELTELFSQEILLVALDHVFNFYAMPGDSLHLILDGNLESTDLTSRSKRYDYLAVTGSNERMNKDYISYQQFLEDSVWSWDEDFEAGKNLNPQKYRKYISGRTEKHKTQVDNFTVANKPAKQFKAFVNNSIRYRALNDLITYPSKYQVEIIRDGWSFPSKYHTFLEEFNFNENEEIISQNQVAFIRNYYSYINLFHLSPDSARKLLELQRIRNKDKNQLLSLRMMKFENIQKNSSGIVQQMLFIQFFNSFLDFRDSEAFQSFYNPELIDHSFYTEQLELKKADLLKQLNDPKTYTAEILKDLELRNHYTLQSLIKSYQGHVIYCDFWAPWCSPCMGEMKYSKQLKERYNEKKVVFAYLANQCSEKSWKQTLAEIQIKGKHVLLNDSEYRHLAGKFKIPGIPHYILISKGGLIVNSNAPRPSSTETITRDIDELLEGS